MLESGRSGSSEGVEDARLEALCDLVEEAEGIASVGSCPASTREHDQRGTLFVSWPWIDPESLPLLTVEKCHPSLHP